MDVIKQSRQLQFVEENQMHPILRPNRMSHMIIVINWLSPDFALGHLLAIWGLTPKKLKI
jgi:hypothetical protein